MEYLTARTNKRQNTANVLPFYDEHKADTHTNKKQPHPHSLLPATQLSKIKIIDPKLVYVVGMSSTYCDRQILASHEWFGQFGTVQAIIFVESLESVQLDSRCFTVVYDNEQSAVAAKRWVISRPHGYDQRKVKAMHGWRTYCQFWLQNKCLLSASECGYLHRWKLPQEEVLSNHDKKQFDAKPSGAVTGNVHNLYNQQWVFQQVVYEDALQQTINEQRHKIRALEMEHEEKSKSENSGNCSFMDWDYKEVYCWIMQIQDGYFEGKYKLLAHLKEENVDGSCLPQIMNEDLKRFGIRNEHDIKLLLLNIAELVGSQSTYQDQLEGVPDGL